MKFIVLLILTIGSITCLRCQNPNPINAKPVKSSQIIEIDIDNPEYENKKIYYSQIIKNVTFAPLETNPKSLIGHINQIQVYGNYLLILDDSFSKSLFIFTKEGDFVRKIGSIGKGPGEYINPDDFCTDRKNNEILILDARAKKINIYDFEGNFKREIRINVGSRCSDLAIQNGNIYVNGNPGILSTIDENYLLNCINENGKTQKRWFKYPEYGWDVPVLFNSPEFFQTETNTKFTNLFINTIYSIRQNEVYPFIKIKSDNIISSSELNEAKESSFKKYNVFTFSEIDRIGKMWGIHNYLENNKILYFRYFNYGGRYQLIYQRNTSNIYCGRFVDDIVHANNEFCAIDSNSLIGFIESRFDKTMEEIVDEVITKNTIIPQQEIRKLEKINNKHNPILIYYELK